MNQLNNLRIFQPDGVSKILPLGKTTESEKGLIKEALSELATNIEKVPFLYPS